MPAPFITEEFLLEGRSARRLYHGYAEGLPIYDYHCHLDVRQIAENHRFRSLAEAWLAGDHYKWRAMRAAGVDERLITGASTDEEKFQAWARTVPSTLGNPLYHWTHLELARYFGVRESLGPGTAVSIYQRCGARLAEEAFRARGLLSMMQVRVICTTDDPTDALESHDALARDPAVTFTVVPCFRPDTIFAIDQTGPFNAWVDRLAAVADVRVDGWGALLEALRRRVAWFHERGCRVSDHGIEEPFAEECSESEADRIFRAARGGTPPSSREARQYASALLVELGRMYARQGWAWQLHLGALRNVSSRGMRRLGPNTGYDTIGDFRHARGLARLLDRLDASGELPKTILYSLNPADDPVLATMAGCFQDGSVPGKVQHGSAWWFNDQQFGIEDQLRSLASLGLLAPFVGMLTDSRSFLSFPRHEYFRRVLANLLGGWMDRGLLPKDFDLVGGTVRDICWGNAVRYFGIALKGSTT
jgi:glucuronate isomerase